MSDFLLILVAVPLVLLSLAAAVFTGWVVVSFLLATFSVGWAIAAFVVWLLWFLAWSS